MKKHLNKQKKCPKKNLESVQYSDDDINELSLIKVYQRNDFKCDFCKGRYSSSKLLKRHVEKYCKKFEKEKELEENIFCEQIKKNEEIIEETIINQHVTNNETEINFNNCNNNTSINNTNININNIININLPVPFDKDWSIEHLDSYIKTMLTICDNKFTVFLNTVLKNKANNNVVYDKEMEDNIYVFTDNKYKTIEKKELIDKSMEKIYNQLNKLTDELSETDEFKNNTVLLQEKDKLNKKYDTYINDDKVKDIVETCISEIYDQNKKEAFEMYREFHDKLMIDGY
jgi:hypothetical protein